MVARLANIVESVGAKENEKCKWLVHVAYKFIKSLCGRCFCEPFSTYLILVGFINIQLSFAVGASAYAVLFGHMEALLAPMLGILVIFLVSNFLVPIFICNF